MCLNIWWNCLGKTRRCGLIGGDVALEVGMRFPKAAIPSQLSASMLLSKMEALSYCFSTIPACSPGWSWTLKVSPSKLSSISCLGHDVLSQQ